MILTIIPIAPDMAPVNKVLFSIQTQTVKFPYMVLPAGHNGRGLNMTDKINNIVTARNAVFDFAMKTGIEYFIMLDADCIFTDSFCIEKLRNQFYSDDKLLAAFVNKEGEKADFNHAGFGCVMFNTMNLLKSGITCKYFGHDCECLNFIRDVKKTDYKLSIGEITGVKDLHTSNFIEGVAA
jgi:hypothetical protein